MRIWYTLNLIIDNGGGFRYGGNGNDFIRRRDEGSWWEILKRRNLGLHFS